MASEDETFAREHEGFVRSIATRVKHELDLTACDLEDLVAYGFQGLLEARERFDDSRGVKFETFAYYRIRGSVIDGVRKMAYLSRRTHHLRKVAEAADAMLEQEGETRSATPEARSDIEGTVNAIDGILSRIAASFVIASMGQDPVEDQLAAPDEQLMQLDTKRRVRAAVASLPERERVVIEGMYLEGRILDDVAAQLGVSKSWASRIHTKGLGLLRKRLDSDH